MLQPGRLFPETIKKEDLIWLKIKKKYSVLQGMRPDPLKTGKLVFLKTPSLQPRMSEVTEELGLLIEQLWQVELDLQTILPECQLYPNKSVG